MCRKFDWIRIICRKIRGPHVRTLQVSQMRRRRSSNKSQLSWVPAKFRRKGAGNFLTDICWTVKLQTRYRLSKRKREDIFFMTKGISYEFCYFKAKFYLTNQTRKILVWMCKRDFSLQVYTFWAWSEQYEVSHTVSYWRRSKQVVHTFHNINLKCTKSYREKWYILEKKIQNFGKEDKSTLEDTHHIKKSTKPQTRKNKGHWWRRQWQAVAYDKNPFICPLGIDPTICPFFQNLFPISLSQLLKK